VTAFGSKKIAVASRSWAEVELLDAGGWFRPEFAGTRLPTLDAALDVIQRGSATLIERKSGDAATCVALLRRKQLLERVVVQSFDWQFLKDCRRQAPKLVLGALGSKELTAEKLDQLSAAGAQIVVWDDKTIGRIEIAAIHGLGLKAWVYTVDDPARAQELIAAGIDGLITNTPAELRALLPDSPSPRQG
jgi:glycerophosphoryl diester phosphodiesterase